MSTDAELGIAWWNHLSEQDRAMWLERAGSAVPADAWAEFNRRSRAVSKNKKLFDEKCYELAKHFAADLDGISEEQLDDLAYDIQMSIEDWITLNYSDPGKHQVDVQ